MLSRQIDALCFELSWLKPFMHSTVLRQEMERDCLVAYGASNLLLERLMLSSDVCNPNVCRTSAKLFRRFGQGCTDDIVYYCILDALPWLRKVRPLLPT